VPEMTRIPGFFGSLPGDVVADATGGSADRTPIAISLDQVHMEPPDRVQRYILLVSLLFGTLFLISFVLY
jgi:hypothetical protein